MSSFLSDLAAKGTTALFGYDTYVNLNDYVFDAYFQMSTQGEMEISQHPVGEGAMIADHAYAKPRIVTLEIGMTNVVTVDTGKPFSGKYGVNLITGGLETLAESFTPIAKGRNTAVYELLSEWQNKCTLIRYNGKYGYIENMLLRSFTTKDDQSSHYGMRATLVLEEILISGTKNQVSSLAQLTNSTNSGLSSTQSVTSQVQSKIGA